jgi:hypothetical protein
MNLKEVEAIMSKEMRERIEDRLDSIEAEKALAEGDFILLADAWKELDAED